MSSRRLLAGTVLASVLLAGLTTAPPVAASAAGTPDRVAFACTDVPNVTNPGTGWGAGQTYHIKGWTATYTSSGDDWCAGTIAVVATVEVSMGRGSVHGPFVYHLANIDGGWTGTYHQTWAYPDALTYGEMVGTGFGALAGWQLRGVLIEAFDGTTTETDVAFRPGA